MGGSTNVISDQCMWTNSWMTFGFGYITIKVFLFSVFLTHTHTHTHTICNSMCTLPLCGALSHDVMLGVWHCHMITHPHIGWTAISESF